MVKLIRITRIYENFKDLNCLEDRWSLNSMDIYTYMKANWNHLLYAVTYTLNCMTAICKPVHVLNRDEYAWLGHRDWIWNGKLFNLVLFTYLTLEKASFTVLSTQQKMKEMLDIVWCKKICTDIIHVHVSLLLNLISSKIKCKNVM